MNFFEISILVVLSLLAGKSKRRLQRWTIRNVLTLIKAKCFLSDNVMTEILTMFHNLKPVMDYKNLPKNGKSLALPAYQFLKNFNVRKVNNNLGVGQQVPLLASDTVVETIAAQRRASPKEGEVLDFSIEDSLFMDGPGMYHADAYRILLRRINAAFPKFLSPKLLKVADRQQYDMEDAKNLLHLRSKMNFFCLKIHGDGVQIAKNGQRPTAIPLLASIDSICPYDHNTKTVDWNNEVRIPYRLAKPFIIVVYHGLKKPDMYQFLEKFFEELTRLDPDADGDDALPRRCVVQIKCIICDSPMKSWFTGKSFQYSVCCTFLTQVFCI